MEQDPLLLKDQADGMDVVVAGKVEVLEKKRMGPPGPCLSRYGSRYSMSKTCGTRDIISLVIPRLGYNTLNEPEIKIKTMMLTIFISIADSLHSMGMLEVDFTIN
jgi:hypothetical protein